MPSRVIKATVTSGSNADKKKGTYVTFGTINSDTGVVANATPVSATLYLSNYKTYTSTCKLHVIFGGSNGEVVAVTPNALESNSSLHEGTHALSSLAASLLTNTVSQLTIGVTSDSSATSNHINIRDGCTLTLTIEYKKNHKTMRYHNGSAWVECVPHYYDGSRWVQCDPYYYDGSGWKECNGS